MIDVAVVNTSAKEYLKDDKAAVIEEVKKKRYYGRATRDATGHQATIPAGSVNPFVFESTTSRLGPSALLF